MDREFINSLIAIKQILLESSDFFLVVLANSVEGVILNNVGTITDHPCGVALQFLVEHTLSFALLRISPRFIGGTCEYRQVQG